MAVDRTRLPAPHPSRSIEFPAIEKSELPNGLRVWTVAHRQVPVVALTVLMNRGASNDPPALPGLAAFTADMLDEGSGDRTSIQVHEEIAGLGTQLETDIGSDATVVGLTVLSRFVDRALGLLGDVVARPALREEDFVRVRQLRLHRLQQIRDIPSAIADRMFVSLLYGVDPYGHTPLGSTAALAAMRADDIRAFHRRVLRPSATTLIAVGDCDHETIRRSALAAFGDWDGPADDAPGTDGAWPTPARLNVIQRPSAPQSELRIGHVALPRNTPDYHALIAANMVLGGQFASRLNMNLREDKGYTYGARTAFDFRRRPGPFVLQVSVQTSATAASIHESMKEIAEIRTARPITQEELDLAIAALTRGYARNFETADQIARAATQLALYELPDSYFAEFVSRVERITVRDATEALVRHLDPERLTTVVVGDYDTIATELDNLNLGVPSVLPLD